MFLNFCFKNIKMFFTFMIRSLKLWPFGLVGNVVGRINKFNQRRVRLVFGKVTVDKRVNPFSM